MGLGKEIKFRAWDKINSKMINHPQVGCGFLNDMFDNQASNWTWQQSTGLYDTNNKEIYEGDICSGLHRHQNGENEYPIKDQVYFSVGGFTLFAKPLQDFTWYYDDITHKQKILKHVMWMTPAREVIPAYYYVIDNIEVIGNIYETPELIREVMI
jgi:uncharacterized phage protein (TIGR01671 family)